MSKQGLDKLESMFQKLTPSLQNIEYGNNKFDSVSFVITSN